MPSRDGGPAVLHPHQPSPPPPCSFVHIMPHQYPTMVQYAPSVSPFTPSPAAAAAGVTAEVRDVWAGNLDDELSTIASLLPYYPCVCVDTEFPGAVHGSCTPRYLRGPRESYALVKRNVDDLKLLQVGVSLSGPSGRLPVAWQFNLRGFDPAVDPHAPDSVAMLRSQAGMDFATMRDFGARPEDLAAGFYRYGLIPGGSGEGSLITWVAFSGAYDFAYLAKALTGGRALPETLEGFNALVRGLFGARVLDVKHLARCCGVKGGLEQVAAALRVSRAAGRAHCAGSDSMLTTDVLLAMLDMFFRYISVLEYAGTIVDLA
ncbi:unnamed protein product [Urochloa decumbens]|uniref:poly(A)-specific ribonuclease n=1 Tax=Urochloa decumbens TaxID=240449 RepID=A0ABC9DTG5_9POAL